MNKTDMIMLNDKALAFLEHGDFSRALMLLKTNAKKNPNHMTWNNLGLFYYENGIETINEKWRAAKKLGIDYLSKAAKAMYNGINSINLASCLFQSCEYERALHLFEGITEPEYHVVSKYNEGICLLVLGNLQCAESLFAELSTPIFSESIKKLDAMDPRIPLAFTIATQVWMGRKKHDTLNKPDIKQLDLDLYDQIWLSYLIGEHGNVVNLLDPFLLTWQPNEIVSAMLLECIENVGGNLEAERKEKLFGVFPQARELLNLEHRHQVLYSKVFIPPLVEICGYYGCKQHHIKLPL